MEYKKRKIFVRDVRNKIKRHKTTYAAANFTVNLCIKKLKILVFACLLSFFDPKID
jgi:hypothetical protein